MPKTFDASVGYSFDNDYGVFDGPDPDLIDLVGNDIGSLEGFGLGKFTVYVETPQPILASAIVGQPKMALHLQAQGGVISKESFGSVGVSLHLSFTGVSSGESIPSPLFRLFVEIAEGVPGEGIIPGPSLSIHLAPGGIKGEEGINGGEVYLQWAEKFSELNPLWLSTSPISSAWIKETPTTGGFK